MRLQLLLAILAVGCSAAGANTTDKYGWRTGVVCSSDSCVHGHCMSKTGRSKCFCSTGWTGLNCDEDIDECSDSHECEKGSTCVNMHGHYKCQCAEGQTGWKCHFKSANCTSNDECMNGGHCVDRSCVCQPDFEGTTCQKEFKNVCEIYDLCLSDQICKLDRTMRLGYVCEPTGNTTTVKPSISSNSEATERTSEILNTEMTHEPQLASTDPNVKRLEEQLAECRFRGNFLLTTTLIIVSAFVALAVRYFRRMRQRSASEDSGQFVNVKFERMSSVSMESSLNEQP